VYGPRDNLFLPNTLEVAGQGMLRIFGNGHNRICFSHVDNYAHGLILGYTALKPGSPCLGKFYIVTDGDTHPDPRGCVEFWKAMEEVRGNLSRFSDAACLPNHNTLTFSTTTEQRNWKPTKKSSADDSLHGLSVDLG